jgi:two-component system sensor histidine kinase BaeS
LLPGLALAGGIALPVAVVLAILLARYVTGPLRGLTAATADVAAGRFDVRVPATHRRDEVGRLAAAFTKMTEKVGESQAQVRALIADVSHNLKTPLTPILGFSRALATGDAEQSDVPRIGAVIHEEAERLAMRLQDLLYLGELESGQAVFQREPADLSALTAAAIPRFLAGIEERDIEIQREIAPNIIVDADVPSLERAVENLLDNVRKYTPPGGSAEVRLHERGATAVLEVTNTAPGLESEELPRLFERFYRSRSATVPANMRPHGSGLGLPIARDIVRLHGGSLTASLAPPLLTLTMTLAISGSDA